MYTINLFYSFHTPPKPHTSVPYMISDSHTISYVLSSIITNTMEGYRPAFSVAFYPLVSAKVLCSFRPPVLPNVTPISSKPDSRNTPSPTNPGEEGIADAPGNDGNTSMPEQVKRPNPWMMMMMMMMVLSVFRTFILHLSVAFHFSRFCNTIISALLRLHSKSHF